MRAIGAKTTMGHTPRKGVMRIRSSTGMNISMIPHTIIPNDHRMNTRPPYSLISYQSSSDRNAFRMRMP